MIKSRKLLYYIATDEAEDCGAGGYYLPLQPVPFSDLTL